MELARCPVRPFLDDPDGINAVMERWRWSRAGMLPESGTWLDQPAKLLDLFQIVDVAMADARVEQARIDQEKRDMAARAAKAAGKGKAKGGRRR